MGSMAGSQARTPESVPIERRGESDWDRAMEFHEQETQKQAARYSNKYSRMTTRGTSQALASRNDVFDQIWLPGSYKLKTFCFHPDIKFEPPMTEIMGVSWENDQPHSRLILPKGFDGDIVSCVATPATLAFYGCCFADGVAVTQKLYATSQYVEFLYDGYKEKWVRNPDLGPGELGIEYHSFVHLEMPLETDSGHILLGKVREHAYEDELVLCVTAFRVPALHTMYIAPNVLHSNDHMEGVWRTFLPAFTDKDVKRGLCDINHAVFRSCENQSQDLHFAAVNDNEAGLVAGWSLNEDMKELAKDIRASVSANHDSPEYAAQLALMGHAVHRRSVTQASVEQCRKSLKMRASRRASLAPRRSTDSAPVGSMESGPLKSRESVASAHLQESMTTGDSVGDLLGNLPASKSTRFAPTLLEAPLDEHEVMFKSSEISPVKTQKCMAAEHKGGGIACRRASWEASI